MCDLGDFHLTGRTKNDQSARDCTAREIRRTTLLSISIASASTLTRIGPELVGYLSKSPINSNSTTRFFGIVIITSD